MSLDGALVSTALSRLVDIGVRHLYDVAQRLGRRTLVLTIKAPRVPKMKEAIGPALPYASDDVLLCVANVGARPIELVWGGIAWISPDSGLPIDEGSTDLRHKSPGFHGQVLLPNRSMEFVVTSTYRLNRNLAWVGVEAILHDGNHRTCKVERRKIRRLVKNYERYRQRVVSLLT